MTYVLDYWKGDQRRSNRFDDLEIMERFARQLQSQGATVEMYSLLPVGHIPLPTNMHEAQVMLSLAEMYISGKKEG